MRRLLFQVHLWLGVLLGLYVVVVCVSGAVLVFRIDLQRALDPHLFTPGAAGPLADPVAVMESVSRAYPQHGLSGVEAPTTRRPVYLAYVTKGVEFRTVLIDPVSAVVLGDLPERAVVRALQDLHYNLLGGRTGRTINGVGALAILVLCATGLVVWWPGHRGLANLGRRGDGGDDALACGWPRRVGRPVGLVPLRPGAGAVVHHGGDRVVATRGAPAPVLTGLRRLFP